MKKSGTSTHFKDHYGDPFCWADSPKNAGGPQWEIFCIMVSMDIYWNIPLGTWTICYVPNYWVRWFIYHNEHFSWQIIWFPEGNKTDDQLVGTKSTKTTGTGPPSWRVQCFGKQKVDTFPHEKLARNLNWSWSKDKLCVCVLITWQVHISSQISRLYESMFETQTWVSRVRLAGHL